MADNSENRKKTLIVSVLAFLFIGGGVFLFFVIQGSNDLTDSGKKNTFTYGGAAREATASFFKFIGFDDVESIAKEGPKERPREKEYAAAGILDSAGTSSKSEDEVPWSRPPSSGRSASPSSIPRMEGGGTSGVGGGGGGSKSSGGVSRFGEGSDSGNTKIAAKAPEAAAAGETGKGTLGALAKTRAMLGEGLRSGSASTAKGKWDASFGSGRAGSGGGSELAYAKSGLVNLDKIKKGEIDNLKTTDPKSLKIPDVAAPVKDEKAGAATDPALKKAQETAEDAIKKSMASSMLGAVGQGLGNSVSGGSGSEDTDRAQGSGPMESGSCAANSSTPLCSSMAKSKVPTDTGISYTQIGSTSEGKIMQVNYAGTGPGITAAYKGETVPYNDACNVLVKPDGTTKVIGWFSPMEGANVAPR
ncbi:MAG: hypothetical protein HY952_01755 [Elusimicrobia bacterium]|nr:hypothetical protein [Elusimicrobiota bacterium]